MSKKNPSPAAAGFVEPMELDDDHLEADIAKTDPAPDPPKNTEDSVRLRDDIPGSELRELGEVEAAGARARAEPRPPRAPVPRGPFVRYHETDERSLHAVVVAAHDDGSVNLHVFPDGPRVNYLQNVPHGYDAGCWEDYL